MPGTGFSLCRPCSGTRRSNAGLLGGSLPTIAAEKEGAIRYLSPSYDLASTLLCVGSEPTRPRPGVREPSKASLELGPAQPSHYPSRCTPSFISPLDFLMEPRYLSIRMSNKDNKTSFLRGTLDLMILQSLASIGPMHGYTIAARLEQVSGGALQPNMGTLYPGLMRLEQRGLIRGSWGTTENNRQARFYSITAAGRRHLAVEKEGWDQMVAIMQALFSNPA